MKHIRAILWKQIKDILKNKTILIQFVMFPLLTVVMENTVKMEGMEEHFFACLFGVMYLGMAPFTSVAAIISEEKEKNTLRALLMANVKPGEYLVGIGIYIWCICMVGVAIIGVAGGFVGQELVKYILIMAVGVTVSCLMGAVVGTMSKNQMMATSITVPVMMVFSFLPMLSMFNESIERIAKFTYTQQIHSMITGLSNLQLEVGSIAIIAANIFIAVILFIASYRRSGLE